MSITQGSLASRFYFCFGECVHNCWKSAFQTCVPVVGECVHNCLNFAIQICAVLVGVSLLAGICLQIWVAMVQNVSWQVGCRAGLGCMDVLNAPKLCFALRQQGESPPPPKKKKEKKYAIGLHGSAYWHSLLTSECNFMSAPTRCKCLLSQGK